MIGDELGLSFPLEYNAGLISMAKLRGKRVSMVAIGANRLRSEAPAGGFPDVDASVIDPAGIDDTSMASGTGIPSGMPSHGVWDSTSQWTVFPSYDEGDDHFSIDNTPPPTRNGPSTPPGLRAMWRAT